MERKSFSVSKAPAAIEIEKKTKAKEMSYTYLQQDTFRFRSPVAICRQTRHLHK